MRSATTSGTVVGNDVRVRTPASASADVAESDATGMWTSFSSPALFHCSRVGFAGECEDPTTRVRCRESDFRVRVPASCSMGRGGKEDATEKMWASPCRRLFCRPLYSTPPSGLAGECEAPLHWQTPPPGDVRVRIPLYCGLYFCRRFLYAWVACRCGFLCGECGSHYILSTMTPWDSFCRRFSPFRAGKALS